MKLFSFLKNTRVSNHPLGNKILEANGSGEVSGFLFENPNVGVSRNLYWSVYVNLHEIEYLDDKWESSIAFEWLTVTDRQQKIESSDRKGLGIECTWYLAEHILAKSWSISLAIERDFSTFDISFSALFDFPGLDGDPCPDVKIAGNIKLPCTEISLMRDNVSPNPNSEEEALEMIRAHFPEIVHFQNKPLEDKDGWPIQNPDKFIFTL